MRRREFLACGAACLAAVPLQSAAASGEYPEETIHLVVPRSAGGVVDVVARLWAEQVRGRLGSVVVENQGGGGGLIAGSVVAHSQPDGYKLLAGTTSELVITPLMVNHPPYDPMKDLTAISLNAVSVSSIMVHASLPVHSLRELVAYAKAHPGTLSYGSAGTGSSSHLCGELFKILAGLPDIVHVPYRGASPGLADLFAGHLPLFISSVSPQGLAMHRAGTIRILAAATDRRLLGAPEIPTTPEAGFPDLIAVQFMGLFAPSGTPKPIIDKIAFATHEAMAEKEHQEKLILAGFEPIAESGPEQAAQFVQREFVRWPPVMKAIGLKME